MNKYMNIVKKRIMEKITQKDRNVQERNVHTLLNFLTEIWLCLRNLHLRRTFVLEWECVEIIHKMNCRMLRTLLKLQEKTPITSLKKT